MSSRTFSALLALSAALLLSSCSITADLYPQSGPLAMQKPLPVLHARINGVTGKTGSATLTMPDGENLKGRWSSVAPTMAGSVRGTVGLTSVSGTYVGIQPGINRGEAYLVGDRGATLSVIFYTGSGSGTAHGHGHGTANDSRGNSYKVLF